MPTISCAQCICLYWLPYNVRSELEISCIKYLPSSSKVLAYTLLCHCCCCCCCHCCCCRCSPALWKMWENFVIQFHLPASLFESVCVCCIGVCVILLLLDYFTRQSNNCNAKPRQSNDSANALSSAKRISCGRHKTCSLNGRAKRFLYFLCSFSLFAFAL